MTLPNFLPFLPQSASPFGLQSEFLANRGAPNGLERTFFKVCNGTVSFAVFG